MCHQSANRSTGSRRFRQNPVQQHFHSEDPCSNNDRNIGIAVGAVAGGVIGYLAHGAKGAAAGALIGAGGGFLVGHVLDARRCELYRIAQANGLKLASAPITQARPNAGSADRPATVGLDVRLENKSDEFVAGSAELTPQARKYLAQIANQYSPKALMAALPPDATPEQRAQAGGRKVLIVGHKWENLHERRRHHSPARVGWQEPV